MAKRDSVIPSAPTAKGEVEARDLPPPPNLTGRLDNSYRQQKLPVSNKNKVEDRAGEKAPRQRALAALTDGSELVLSSHGNQKCNSSSEGSGTLFWPPRVLHAPGGQTCKQTLAHTHKNKYFLP